MKKLLLSLSLLLVCVAGNAQKNPVLTIEGGQVQGVLADDHPEVFVYRGIPYAAPGKTVGKHLSLLCLGKV